MPSEIGPDDTTAGAHVTIAPLIDLHFSLFLLSKHCTNPDRWVPVWIAELDAVNRRLVDELMAFWTTAGLASFPSGEPYREWGELLVGACRAGVLLAPDPALAIGPAVESLAEPFETPALLSEPPAVWDVVDQRIAHLRRDAGARARYRPLLEQLWAV